MKKIIDGKIYNTETAERICGYQYGTPGDFTYCSEDLYKTRKGAYFVAGEGGALTRYSRSTGDNSTTGGEGLRVLPEDEARKWCEQYGTADDYVRTFGAEEA